MLISRFKMNQWFSNPIWETTLNLDNLELINFAYSSTLLENKHEKNLSQGGHQYFNIENPPANYTLLLKEINEILFQIQKSVGFKINYRSFVKESWININIPNSYNMKHFHHRNMFSGVYYVKVPNGDCGDIIFYNNNLMTNYLPPYIVKEWNNLNSSTVSYKPKEGMLLIFPGWLEHSVTTNLTDQDRVSISFNANYE